MYNKFDELTEAFVQSTTRRQALKKFGVPAAGALLACFGLANSAEVGQKCGHSKEPCARLGAVQAFSVARLPGLREN